MYVSRPQDIGKDIPSNREATNVASKKHECLSDNPAPRGITQTNLIKARITFYKVCAPFGILTI